VKWATRANIHIDRAACAWLIRRHVDPDAEFVFISDPAELPAAATLFDMRVSN
jgi:hypothetical protein